MNVLTQERTWKKTAFLSFKIVVVSSFVQSNMKGKRKTVMDLSF